MKFKTKVGFRSGKTVNHRICVDDNTVLCAALAASTVVAGRVVEGITRMGITAIEGMNDRAERKLEYKLDHPKEKPKK